MIIEASGLARTFRTKKAAVEAVRGVSLQVEEGEVVGLLGPNGAGKTTTLRMLSTLLVPTAGRAVVAGCDLATNPVGVRRRIGYVSQSGSTLSEARAGDEVVTHAMLYGLSRREATARGRQLFEALDLSGMWERTCRTLSGGQRRRLDIVMGLVHEPALVFLDEPTTGLDPQARANLWEHVRGLQKRGTTVFLTTHYLDEADALCERVLVIDHGEIVASGTPDALKEKVRGDLVRLTVAETEAVPTLMAMARRVERADEVTHQNRVVSFRVPKGASVLASVVREADANGVELESIEVHRPTLDDVFLTMTGRSLRDGEPSAFAQSEENASQFKAEQPAGSTSSDRKDR